MSDSSVDTNDKTEKSSGFKNDVQRLGEHVSKLHEDLSGLAKGTSEVAQSGIAAMKEGGRHTIAAAKEKSALATTSVRGRISRHPWATLGVAVGAGILVGVAASAINRTRRSSSRGASSDQSRESGRKGNLL